MGATEWKDRPYTRRNQKGASSLSVQIDRGQKAGCLGHDPGSQDRCMVGESCTFERVLSNAIEEPYGH